MKKVFTKIAGLSVGLALAIGVGVVAGNRSAKLVKATEITDTLCDFTAKTSANTNYASEWDYGSFKIFGGANNNGAWEYVSFGSKRADSETQKITNAYVKTTAAISADISSVSFTVTTARKQGGTVNVSLDVASDSGFESIVQNVDLGVVSQNTATTHRIAPSSGTFGTGKYYRVNITCTNTTKTNGMFSLTSISFNKESSAVSPTSISCVPQSLEVASTLNLANAVTFAPAGTTEKGLSFTLKSGSEYAELSEAGVITGKKGGSAVVTITPEDTSAGATAIDVAITVNSIAAPAVTIGDQYVIYNADAKRELTEVTSGNIGTASTYSGDVPSCSYVLTAENGIYENTVAFSDGSKYLSLNSSANNLYTSSEVNTKSSWVVSVTDDVLTVANVEYPNRQIQYNANVGQERFACYTGGQTAISLYHYVDKPLTDFTIESEVEVYLTGTKQIQVTYTPADASDKELSWSSTNEGIATVDNDGVVTGVAVGEVEITASKTIGGVLVERTCTVSVLNNVSVHHGTEEDPFNVADAVQVASGVFTKDPDGNDINLENSYYVEGIITMCNQRTTSQLTFWIGDNNTQISAATGGFQVYKAALVYNVALATAYASEAAVKVDFNKENHVKVYSTLTLYNGTPETTQNVADVVYCDYIEARTYAAAFNAAFEAEGVCDADGESVVETLASVWSEQSTAYSALDSYTKSILVSAEGSTTSSATDVQKCAAKYDYIGGKYNTQLSAEYDFMGRNPTPISSGRFASFSEESNDSTMIIIIAIAGVSALALTTLLVLKKKKHN